MANCVRKLLLFGNLHIIVCFRVQFSSFGFFYNWFLFCFNLLTGSLFQFVSPSNGDISSLKQGLVALLNAQFFFISTQKTRRLSYRSFVFTGKKYCQNKQFHFGTNEYQNQDILRKMSWLNERIEHEYFYPLNYTIYCILMINKCCNFTRTFQMFVNQLWINVFLHLKNWFRILTQSNETSTATIILGIYSQFTRTNYANESRLIFHQIDVFTQFQAELFCCNGFSLGDIHFERLCMNWMFSTANMDLEICIMHFSLIFCVIVS